MTTAKNICCRICKDTKNYDISTFHLSNVNKAIDYSITKYMLHENEFNCFGYSSICTNLSSEDFDRLSMFKDIIDNIIERRTREYHEYLCKDEIQCLIEKVLCMVNINNCNNIDYMSIDRTGRDLFIENNPECFEKFSIKIDIIPEQEELVIDTSIEKQKQDELIIDYNIASEDCNIVLDSYKVIEQRCSIDFNSYSELISKDLSIDLVVDLVDRGLDFNFSVKENKLDLIITGESKLEMKDLEFLIETLPSEIKIETIISSNEQ